MNYIYDIYLNFQKNLYEFYDWNTRDKIWHIRKIPVIKIETKNLKDIVNNEVIFNLNNLNIENRCEYYEGKGIKKLKYAFLLTDGENVVAINVSNNCNYKSKLLLFEEEDVCSQIKKLDISNIDYSIVRELKTNWNLTRQQQNMFSCISEFLEKLYNEREYEKIKYIYYECFNKKENDVDKIYKNIDFELKNNFEIIGPKIYNFYKITKNQCI